MSEDPASASPQDRDEPDDEPKERPPRPLDDDELVDESSMESFPASDPPSANPGAD